MQIRVLGLLPYIVHYLRTESLIAYIVVNNGILYHILLPTSEVVKWYDIICNVYMMVFVNIQVQNIYVFTWTCFAAGCFIYNSLYIKRKFLKGVFHIAGVQLPLYRALTLTSF